MGLLDGVLGGGAQDGRPPGLGDTIAAGAVLALLVKAVRQYQASHGGGGAAAGGPPAAQAQGGGLGRLLGGLFSGGGGLGGMLSGGGLGGVLGSLGGAGALGALVDRFQQKGFAAQAGSWVGNGPNEPIAPHEVGNVLGDGALQQLEARTGLPRDQLLQELARELPQAISEATPNGRLPQDHELEQQLRS